MNEVLDLKIRLFWNKKTSKYGIWLDFVITHKILFWLYVINVQKWMHLYFINIWDQILITIKNSWKSMEIKMNLLKDQTRTKRRVEGKEKRKSSKNGKREHKNK